MRAVRRVAAAGVVLLLAWSPALAQTGQAQARGPGRADTTVAVVSPGGAFLRSLVLPGWGHAAVGSHTRGGFYFATSGATAWMVFKTAHFLSAAEDHRDLLVSEVEKELVQEGVTDPDTIRTRIEGDPRVARAENTVEIRSQQMEDWTAFGIFWLLLAGADAFVSAHLADFPEPVEIRVRPGPPGRPAELGISIPVGPRD